MHNCVWYVGVASKQGFELFANCLTLTPILQYESMVCGLILVGFKLPEVVIVSMDFWCMLQMMVIMYPMEVRTMQNLVGNTHVMEPDAQQGLHVSMLCGISLIWLMWRLHLYADIITTAPSQVKKYLIFSRVHG